MRTEKTVPLLSLIHNRCHYSLLSTLLTSSPFWILYGCYMNSPRWILYECCCFFNSRDGIFRIHSRNRNIHLSLDMLHVAHINFNLIWYCIRNLSKWAKTTLPLKWQSLFAAVGIHCSFTGGRNGEHFKGNHLLPISNSHLWFVVIMTVVTVKPYHIG